MEIFLENLMTNYDKIYSVIKNVPEGCVATYGQIAEMAGIPRNARQVGYALSNLPQDKNIPWHRIINAKGEVSTRARLGRENVQRILLEEEGIEFDANGRVSLDEFGWGY